MALFSEVSQDEEHSSNNNLKYNKRNTSSSSSSRSSHSDSGVSSGSRSISKAVVAAISKLSSSKNLSLSNSRLSLDLSVLSALVTVPATTTSTLDAKKLFISSSLYQAAISVKERVLGFIKETVLVHGFEGIGDEDEVDEGNGGGRSTSDIVCAALKLWTAFVTVTADSLNHQNKDMKKADEGSEDNVEDDNVEKEAEAEGESDGNGSEESDMPADVMDLVHVLFECIGCGGASVCGLELDGSIARLAVYESAALCAVECIRLCVVGRFLQVGYWHSLGWAFLASNDGMRRRLLGALNAVIQTTAVHPRFLAYPCLFATDDVLAPIAEQGLMFAVRRLRSTHDGLCGLAIEKNSDKLRALAEINMPETILPYVLHLLSYHPDFPTSSSIEDEADKRRLKGITKNLRMVTDTLLNSLQDDIGNLSFLLKQVNMISQHYEDSTDCENIGLNFVTILATKILSEKIKTQENVLAYPGDVRLPIELFQLRKGNPKRGQNVLEGLGDVDQAIEKVLKKGGRMAGNKRALGRNVLKSKSVSPKKRTQPSPKVKIVLDRLTNEDNDDDEDDEEDSGEKGGGSASRAKVPKKAKLSKARLPVEAPERVSSRLQRGGGRPSVSYEEKEESDDEMEGWEAAAAEISLSQSNRLSKGSGTGSGSGGRTGTGTGTGSIRESFSGLSGQKRNRKEADDEDKETEESAKDESADDDDDDYDAAIKKTILKPKQSAASSSSSSSSSARIARVITKQFKNHPVTKKEEDYSDRTESSPEKKDDASASPSQSPVSPLSPVVASSNNSPGKKENEHNRHVQRRVEQDEGEERSEEQSEEEAEEEEESSEDVRPNRRSKVQPKKPPSRSTATAKVSKPQEQKKVS